MRSRKIRYKEQMFQVSKKIPFEVARREARKFFNSDEYGFNFHCANNNNFFSRFDYPLYQEQSKENYIFIGEKK